MQELFNNKYRIKSARLKHWDYASDAAYFVTICTKDRICSFGNVMNGKMILSDIGNIVSDEWIKTEKIRKYITLDEWIIMPNHLHGIVIIKNSPVETHCNASLQRNFENKFGPQKINLSSIIRGFKGSSTKRIHLLGYRNFAWQPRFYESIIRNERSLDRIREYIVCNLFNWNTDENNPNNVIIKEDSK